MSRSLLINGELINPPSSISCVRDIAMIAHEKLHLDVLIECVSEKDFYYKFLKTFGVMDYIDDLTKFGEEEGMRIDTDYNFHPTIYVTSVINAYNLHSIIKNLGCHSLL